MKQKTKIIFRTLGVVLFFIGVIDDYLFQALKIGEDSGIYLYIISIGLLSTNVMRSDRNKLDITLLIGAIIIPFIIAFLRNNI